MGLLGPSSSTAITLNLQQDYTETVRPLTNEFSRSFDGTLYRANEVKYREFKFEVGWVTSSNAALVQSWWLSSASVYWWPDPDIWANSAWPVVIANKTLPLDRWQFPYYNEFKRGQLYLVCRSGF